MYGVISQVKLFPLLSYTEFEIRLPYGILDVILQLLSFHAYALLACFLTCGHFRNLAETRLRQLSWHSFWWRRLPPRGYSMLVD